MSFSFSVNLYNAINLYSGDTYYYYEEIGYRILRYNAYVKDLRSSLCYRNENNKVCFGLPSSDVIEVRMQSSITWRESILRVRVFLSDGLLGG